MTIIPNPKLKLATKKKKSQSWSSEAELFISVCTFLQFGPATASTSLEDIYCIRSCNNFCLVIVVRERERERENVPIGQTYLYRIIYRHSQVVYSKPLGGKSRIVKLVRGLKKKKCLFFCCFFT